MKTNNSLVFCCRFERLHQFVGSLSLILFSSFTINASTAYSWSASLITQPSGVVVFNLNCDDDERLCNSTCNNSMNCQIESASCYDCASTSNYALQDLLSGIGTRYRTDANSIISNDLFFRNLVKPKFIFIDEKTLFNFEERYEDDDFKRRLKSLCPSDDQNPILIVKLTQLTLRKNDIKFVICNSNFENADAKVFRFIDK